MKKLIIILLSVFALAMPAQAKIGETLQELMKRFGNTYYTHKTQAGLHRFNLRNYFVVVLIENGVSVAEIYSSQMPLVNGEPPNDIVRGILRTEAPGRKWKEVQVAGEDYAMTSDDNRFIATLRYKKQPRDDGSIWAIQIIPTTMAPPTGTPAQSDAKKLPTQSATVQQVPDKKDCGIIAAEAFARLKPVTYWCRILGIQYTRRDLGKTDNHAMVAFKYETDGNVFVYDDRGTLEIETTSEDPDFIKAALQEKIDKAEVPTTLMTIKFLTK